MSIDRKSVATVAACLLISAPVSALTLDEAVERALASNPRVNAARAMARAAELGPAAAGPILNPEIEGEAAPVTFGDTYEAELGVNQKIPVWGATGAARAVAKAEIVRLSWAARDAELVVAQGARERYRRVALLEERLSLSRLQEEREAWAAGQARARFPHGEVSEIDLRRLEARSTLRAATARAAEARLSAARLDLALWIGLADTAGLRVDPVTPGPLAVPVDPDTLAAGRPDVRELEAAWRVAQAEVDLARASRFENPEVGIFMRWTRGEVLEDTGTESFLGGRFTFPLPWPGSRGPAGDFARARAEAARIAWETRRRVAAEEIRVAMVEAEAARAGALQGTAGAVDSVRAAVRLAEEAWRAGRIDAFELIEVSRTAQELEELAVESLERWYDAVALVEERAGRTLAPSVRR